MRLSLAVAFGLALLSSAQTLFAISITQFNNFVVFGDSLSDTGNVSIVTGGLFPGDNYAPGRFTDGPATTPAVPPGGPQGLWIDQLSATYNIPGSTPFLTGGTNYAVGSANTGSNGLYDVTDQLNYFSVAHAGSASPSSLYFLWAGADDLISGNNSGKTAADNLYKNIQTLAAEGGKYFVWFDLPPLGTTPHATTHGLSSALNTATDDFNNEWYTDVQSLKALGINVIAVDVGNMFAQLAANPALYGFTNISDSAQGVSGINPDQYLFWDDIHPTTAAHALIAQAVEAAVTDAPEPMNLGLVALGFVSLVALKAKLRIPVRHR